MKSLLLLTALAVLAGSAQGAQWAVLVCGSKGWWNYRHHADVCHAFHMLRARGIPAENIVTMLYDDGIVDNRRNPFKGALYNRPSEADGAPVDVYAGCQKDYRMEDVTPENFYAVLTGDEETVRGKGTGRVLRSGPDDDVFVNFVDHGAPGIVVMPGGDVYAEDLMRALQQMDDKRMFKRLVFYMEACESGSMFADVPEQLAGKMFAVTAANAKESSFATYCPPLGDKVMGKHVGTCLGDEFSVRWLEDTDAELADAGETLSQQFERVRARTEKSHVLEFGALEALGGLPIDEFFGAATAQAPALRSPAELTSEAALPPGAAHSHVDSRDVKLVSLLHAAAAAPHDAETALELEQELVHRRRTTEVVRAVTRRALPEAGEEVLSAVVAARGRERTTERACHRAANEAFKRACHGDGAWTDFSLEFSAALQEICERRPAGGIEALLAAIYAECGGADAVPM